MVKILEVYGDSALVISQVKGYWEAHDHKLISYKEHVLKLIPYFNEIILHHTPREENQLVDALVTLASMFKVKWANKAPSIQIENLDELTYCLAVEEEVDGQPWFYDIKRYLEKQEYPENASITDKMYLRKLSTMFFFNGGVLYKRNHGLVFLRCVNRHKAN